MKTDNEVIAEFMGEEISAVIANYGVPLRVLVLPRKPISATKTGRPIEAKYNSSWDWLMPVVIAIEEIEEPHPSNNPERGTVWPYQFEILSRSIVQIIDNRSNNAIVTINQHGLTKIESVYKAVLQFIKWHNEKL